MKKVIYFLMIINVSVLLGLASNGCSGGVVIPEPVCEYGQITCETINFICANYPQVPPEICEYSNLACLALTVLCSSDPESSEYKAAETSLVYINQRLKGFINGIRADVQ